MGAFAKTTPLENVKNLLLAKIKEIYVPDETAKATEGVARKLKDLDFTGAGEGAGEENKPLGASS